MNALANQAHRHYQRTQVESASPAKLVLMLYDGAVRYLNRAVGCLEAGAKEGFVADVVRAQKIVLELMSSLEPSKSPEVAANLERIYEYMVHQLSLAMVRSSAEQAIEVRGLLESLREGWQGAINQVAQVGAAVRNEQASVNLPEVSRGRADHPSVITPGLIPTLNIAG